MAATNVRGQVAFAAEWLPADGGGPPVPLHGAAGPEWEVRVGLNPIVTSQYSSPTSYQVSYHIQWLFF